MILGLFPDLQYWYIIERFSRKSRVPNLDQRYLYHLQSKYRSGTRYETARAAYKMAPPWTVSTNSALVKLTYTYVQSLL